MNFVDKYLSPASFIRSPSDEGGGAPAPTETVSSTMPSASVPESPSDSGATNTPTAADSGGDDFSGFDDAGDDLDSIDLGAGTSPSPEAPQAQPGPSSTAKDAKAPPSAAKAEEVKPVAVEAPTPKAGASPPSELDTLVQSVDANQPALIDWLAKNAFALTKEEAEAFELDAVGNVPKLMARVAVNNMKSTMNTIKSIVPQMIAAEVAKITSSQSKAKEAIGEFYSANPHLNEKEHGALVTKWANAYRVANPSASRKDAIAYVGKAVSFEAGINPSQGTAQRSVPFAPARPGARQPVVTNAEQNPFEMLGGDIDD